METPSLHWLDIAVIVFYLLAMLAMGSHFMRRQKSASEYLLAGRSVGWLAIGLSLLSSLNSAMDYVVGPASYMEWGLILSVGMISIVLAFPIVLKIFIPFYQRLNVYNCYEYLEYRFDVGARTTASVIFMLWRFCWMAFTLYLPAFALNKALGLPLLETIIGLGLITTAYTTMGGVRGVVWTDVVQAVVMFAGILIAIGLLLWEIPGGLRGMWDVATQSDLVYFTARIPGWEEAHGFWHKTSLYFHYPITFFAIVIATFVGQLNNYGSDQVMIQRYLAARSLGDCKKGFITNAIAYIVYVTLFMFLSIALLAYFQQNPLPEGTRYEDYFPYFIGTRIPVVLKGLILAAIYSAAQSSVSSGITAVTSVVYANFYQRLFLGQVQVIESTEPSIQRRQVQFNRLCAVACGIVVTGLACCIKELGPLFELANKIVSCFSGVMIPIFLLGMFSRGSRSLGVSMGAVCGVLVMLVWGFGHDWGWFDEALGYGWTSTVGFVTTVMCCMVVSTVQNLVGRSSGDKMTPENHEFLWTNVMRRPLKD